MIARATEEIKKDPKDPTNYLARGYLFSFVSTWSCGATQSRIER
jgi:hypothetical protein